MAYNGVHGIRSDEGATIGVYCCPCPDCQNVIMDVIDRSGTAVTLDLTCCEFERLLNAMVAFAQGVAEADCRCPKSGRHGPAARGDDEVTRPGL